MFNEKVLNLKTVWTNALPTEKTFGLTKDQGCDCKIIYTALILAAAYFYICDQLKIN